MPLNGHQYAGRHTLYCSGSSIAFPFIYSFLQLFHQFLPRQLKNLICVFSMDQGGTYDCASSKRQSAPAPPAFKRIYGVRAVRSSPYGSAYAVRIVHFQDHIAITGQQIEQSSPTSATTFAAQCSSTPNAWKRKAIASSELNIGSGAVWFRARTKSSRM